MKSRLAIILIALATTSSAFAQANPGFTRVLFPVALYDDVRGAGGSIWRTSFSIVNVGSEPAQLAVPHACINCQSGARALRPNVTYSAVPVPGRDGIPGSFLFIDEDQAESVRFGVNVRDVSRQADNLGVEIPVARERDFRSDRITLLRIPRDDRYRYHLRVYAFNDTQVTINVYEESESIPNGESLPADLLLGTTSVSLVNTARQFQFAYPSFGQATSLPGIAGTSERPVRIDVVPAPGVRVWAFLTITNNVTQDVTVVSPQ
jgi:hypothetical protein